MTKEVVPSRDGATRRYEDFLSAKIVADPHRLWCGVVYRKVSLEVLSVYCMQPVSLNVGA